MTRAELVFVPTPAIGHLVSVLEFSKRLLDRCDRFSVTILVMKSPMGASVSQSNTSSPLPAASHDHIKLIHLPKVDPPTELHFGEKYITDYIESYKNHIRDTIHKQVLPNTCQIAGVVVDMFCTSMIDIAHELRVPSFVLFTSGAAFLGLLLYLPKRYQLLGKVFDKFDSDSIVTSYINPIPTYVLPGFVFNIGGYICFADHARRFQETKGIIVNTLFELESHAVENVRSQLQPPVYTVGPLIDVKGDYNVQSDSNLTDKIMKWLDDQPPKSVVFLCFGSFGSFNEAQLKEIAIGLEQSGLRFLWSVRQSPPSGTIVMPGEYTNYEGFLPEGFMERTEKVGMLCGWAPQLKILGHKATGAFVSHCGWNSILESLWHGVPIVTWPLYAEQQINAFQLTRDLGLATELRAAYNKDGGDVVMANEIEKAVRSVMESDGEIRKRIQVMSEICKSAVEDGGSSSTSFGSWIEVLLEGLKSN